MLFGFRTYTAIPNRVEIRQGNPVKNREILRRKDRYLVRVTVFFCTNFRITMVSFRISLLDI